MIENEKEGIKKNFKLIEAYLIPYNPAALRKSNTYKAGTVIVSDISSSASHSKSASKKLLIVRIGVCFDTI